MIGASLVRITRVVWSVFAALSVVAVVQTVRFWRHYDDLPKVEKLAYDFPPDPAAPGKDRTHGHGIYIQRLRTSDTRLDVVSLSTVRP